MGETFLFDPFHASLFKLRRTQSGLYCYIITNPALHTGLLKFDYSVVLEQQSCSTLMAIYEMNGRLNIIRVTTATQSNLKNLGAPTETVTEP